MSWFCKHDWEKVSEVMMESPFQQMASSSKPGVELEIGHAGPRFFRQAHILILKCRKCGRIYKSVVRNPPSSPPSDFDLE